MKPLEYEPLLAKNDQLPQGTPFDKRPGGLSPEAFVHPPPQQEEGIRTTPKQDIPAQSPTPQPVEIVDVATLEEEHQARRRGWNRQTQRRFRQKLKHNPEAIRELKPSPEGKTVQERYKAYKRKYEQRPDVKERQNLAAREHYHRKRAQDPALAGFLDKPVREE